MSTTNRDANRIEVRKGFLLFLNGRNTSARTFVNDQQRVGYMTAESLYGELLTALLIVNPDHIEKLVEMVKKSWKEYP